MWMFVTIKAFFCCCRDAENQFIALQLPELRGAGNDAIYIGISGLYCVCMGVFGVCRGVPSNSEEHEVVLSVMVRLTYILAVCL